MISTDMVLNVIQIFGKISDDGKLESLTYDGQEDGVLKGRPFDEEHREPGDQVFLLCR